MINNYPVIKNGLKQGKTSVIFAGIHGNETCGIEAFNQILPYLEVDSGTVIFQIGNPRAVEQNVRFTEMNLNRAFKDKSLFTKEEIETYEYKRAQELKLLLNDADALLDIHSSRNAGSERFVIAEQRNFLISDQLPFTLQVSGFEEFEPGGTEGYMKDKIGICVECGQHVDPGAVSKAKESILSFLVVMGHIQGENKIYNQKKIKISFLYKNKNKDFKLSRVFKDFEDIEKGLLIGHDGDDLVYAPYSAKIIFAHDIEDKADQECFLLARKFD